MQVFFVIKGLPAIRKYLAVRRIYVFPRRKSQKSFFLKDGEKEVLS